MTKWLYMYIIYEILFFTFVTTDEWITSKAIWAPTNRFVIIDCAQCSR